MKKYLVSFLGIMSAFGCDAQNTIAQTILECSLNSGTKLVVRYDDINIYLTLDNEHYKASIKDVIYNKNSRFQSEYTIIKLPNGTSIFKSFDANFGNENEFGLSHKNGMTDICSDTLHDGFQRSIKALQCDKTNALGCE